MGLRRAIKAHLTEEQLARVRSLRQDLGLGAVIGSVLSVLPDRSALVVRERLSRVGRLDYRDRAIHMDLSSPRQLDRLNGCTKEPDLVDWLRATIKPGDVFYDVGANVGAYSLVAHAIGGSSCRTYAFEPSPATYAALCRNVALNGAQGTVIPVPLALSNETRLLTLHYRDLAPGAAEHAWEGTDSAGPSFQAVATQPMFCLRLDDAASTFGIPPPSLMKIDVDGAEWQLLQGAALALESPSMRALALEVDEKQVDSRKIVEFLGSKGLALRHRYPRVSRGVSNFFFERRAAIAAEPVTKAGELGGFVCPCCGGGVSGPEKILYRGLAPVFQGRSIVQCAGCGLVSVHPRPEDADLDAYYGSYWKGDPAEPRMAKFARQAEARSRFIGSALAGPDQPLAVLDVGAGFGQIYPPLARGRAVSYDAVEVDPEALRFLREQIGARRVVSRIEEVGGPYDLVVLSHLLEHLTRPVDLLRQLRDRLVPAGVLFVEVPNGDHRFKTKDEPHLTFFRPETLARTVERAGFRIATVETCGTLVSDLQARPTVLARALGRARRALLPERNEPPSQGVDEYGGDRRWIRLLAHRASGS